MNKSELIEAVAVITDQPKINISEMFDGLREVIHTELKAGREVTLHGIGKFKPHTSKERQGRNPSNGHRITIAPKTRAKFYSSKSLDDTLNG
jgi:DNA-binding protein HU-beta